MNKGCLTALGAALVIFSIALGIYFYNQSKQDPVTYELEKPVIMDIVNKTVATGAVRPRKEINIKPQVSGVVDELYVEPGMQVTKGQKLAKIQLIPNEVNINNARSSVELARIRWQEAQRELERQKEVFDKNLDVQDARSRYENAKKDEERYRQLLNDGVVSEETYNQYKLEMELAKAALDNAQLLSGNTLKQFKASVDIAKQEYDAAVNNLQLLQEGASRNSKQVANVVTSTVDGMVLDVPVEEGTSVIERNNFNEGTTIATIADMNSLIFEGQVDESDVGKLKEGMPLELTVGAIEDETFAATLEYIAPKGEDVEGTVKFEVRAAIKPTEDVFLRAGYSANADIILDRREQVLAIKERNVIFENEATFVEIKTGEKQYKKEQVELGLSDGIYVELLSAPVDTTNQLKVQYASGE